MPRRRRYCPVGIPVHVIQRGNNRQTLFTSDSDVAAYADWLSEGAGRFQVEVHGWVFMTNHVHLLLRPLKEQALSRLTQSLGRRYVASVADGAWNNSGQAVCDEYRANIGRYF